MLRLQPVFEVDLPTAQLAPPEVDPALSVLEEGGASSAHLGKRPSSPWHRVRGGKPVCFGKYITFTSKEIVPGTNTPWELLAVWRAGEAYSSLSNRKRNYNKKVMAQKTATDGSKINPRGTSAIYSKHRDPLSIGVRGCVPTGAGGSLGPSHLRWLGAPQSSAAMSEHRH